MYPPLDCIVATRIAPIPGFSTSGREFAPDGRAGGRRLDEPSSRLTRSVAGA